MDLQIPLDSVLSAEEQQRLRRVLRVRDDQEFASKVDGLARAGLREYVEMLLGNRIPTAATEVRALRLLYLIQHVFEGRLPTEAEISRLFQLNDTQSRTLLGIIRSRSPDQVDRTFARSIHELLNAPDAVVESDTGMRLVVIPSWAIRDEIARILNSAAVPLEPMRKVPNSNQYRIARDTFDYLCRELEERMQ